MSLDLNELLDKEIEKQKGRVKELKLSPDAKSLSDLLAPILGLAIKLVLDSLEAELRERLDGRA